MEAETGNKLNIGRADMTPLNGHVRPITPSLLPIADMDQITLNVRFVLPKADIARLV